MADTVFGDVIDKADIVSAFTSEVRNKVEYETYWYTGIGGYTGYTGFPSSWLGPRNPSGPSDGSFGPDIVASSIVTVLHNWCDEYSKVRKLRWKRTGNTYSAVDQTVVANMDNNNSAVQYGLGSDAISQAPNYDVSSGEVIQASDFNSYVDYLFTRWQVYRNNVYNYTSYYCHNSCHQSCHNSFRFRR
jgi:hypothetical protein